MKNQCGCEQNLTKPTKAGDTLISAAENRRMFDRIAPQYDRLNSLMSLGLHRYWRKKAVQCLLAQGGRDFLDLGCGTGDVSLAVLRQTPSAHITGIDPSPDMLDLARLKTRKAQLSDHIVYQEGDAMALPFPNASFDGVICAFVIRNVTDRAAALHEMLRILKPGGTLAILELTAPRNPLLKLIHNIHTRRVIPLLGRLLSQGSAYQYLADSIDHFPPAPAIVELLARTGFADAKRQPLTGGFVTLFSGRAPAAPGRETP